MVHISLIIGRRGFGCEEESFGGVTFDICCMSRFNHVPYWDTLCRDAISSSVLVSGALVVSLCELICQQQ